MILLRIAGRTTQGKAYFGKAKSASYEMAMTFGRMSEPLTKVQKVDSTRTAQSYDFTYRYEDDSHPTAPTQVGHDHYTYDANGNPILVENDSLNTERRMYWDEDNRLMVLSDNGKTSRYTYNAAGERIVKSHGDLEGVYINGAPQGISFHETEDYTIYPAPIITVTKNRFTKHYFIGSKRIASKIGTGRFSNVYGIGGNNITAGQKDYAARMMQIEKQREEYYKQLGTPPGVPTMKGATADPDNTGIGYNSIITDLGDHSVPEGWIQHPKFNGKGDVPGPPIQWSEPESPDNAQPGYGYIANDTTKEETFFYHSDHLGSTSYITDEHANITQFDAYLPYGELLVDEHSSSEELPYKFNGKQFDDETGLYYYGARYMNPVASIWYGVDPIREMYVANSCYIYCLNNPIIFIDPNGKKVKIVNDVNQGLSVIRGTLPKKLRKFVAVTDGYIDKGMMEQGLLAMGDNISDNYLSLYELVSDKDKTVEFAVTSDKSAKDKNGNLMSPKDIPLSFNDPVCDVYSDNKPEPRGSVGYTLAPLSHKWTKNDELQRNQLQNPLFSVNGNYRVEVNGRLLKYRELENILIQAAAHELYSHTLFMFRGIDALHNVSRTGGNSNEKLEKWQRLRMNEANQNFNNQ